MTGSSPDVSDGRSDVPLAIDGWRRGKRFKLVTSAGDSPMLVPTGPSRRPAKTAPPPLLDLFERFDRGEPPPRHLFDDRALRAWLASLLFDGIVDARVAGVWSSGPEAAALVEPHQGAEPIDDARDAIRLGALHARRSMHRAVSRMYGFGRVPLTRRWLDRVGGGAREPFLTWCTALGGPRPAGWTPVAAEPGSPWQYWSRRASSALPESDLRFKVYVNCQPDWLPVVLAALFPVLAEAGVRVFKIAADADAALRPDRVVIYVGSRDAVDRVALAVRRECAGVPHAALAFAARIEPDGLLAWGLDPPAGVAMPGVQERSWRSWVCTRLAAALAGLPPRTPLSEQVRLAGCRIALEGVDPRTWQPGADLQEEWE